MLHRRPALRAPVASDTSLFVTFKGLGAYDYPSSFAWPPPQDASASGLGEVPRSSASHSSASSGVSSRDSDYATHYRSPFSVLRSRQSRVNRCATGMLGSSFDTSTRYLLVGGREAPCSKPFCCCSALLYSSTPAPATFPSSPNASAAHTETAERVRDDFLWALKIGGVEDLLQSTLGAELHARLMRELGAASTVAAVLTCSDPIQMAQLVSVAAATNGLDVAAAASPAPAADAAGNAYVARLLLSTEEDNRIRWLQEESAAMEPVDYYSRAPSLRALFVMWSLLQHLQRTRSTSVLGSGVGVGGPAGGDRGSDSWDHGTRVRSPASARSPSSLVPSPRMSEVRHVLLRMEERRMEVCMSDIAALAALGSSGSGAAAVPESDFWDSLAKQLRPQEVAAALRASSASSADAMTAQTAGLQHILVLCLLLRYVLLVRAELTQRDAAAALPQAPSALAARNKMLLPITAFEAASDVIQLRKALTETSMESSDREASVSESGGGACGVTAAIRDALVALSDVVLRHAYEMAEASHIPSSSPHLPELTTWLLREMVASPACAFHFKRLVDRSITEALVALEKSGLVNRSTIDLKVVVRQLLPLLESCGSEDLYTSVLRDVLSALEEKARRDGYAFSAEDLQHLAELGTQLFSSGPGDSTSRGFGLFDETARGQMEELHVMDGSPWALCVSSYRSLKEMLQGIVRDQRRLREQVQDQLRQLSNASSLTAVMTGTGGEADASARSAPQESTGAAQTHAPLIEVGGARETAPAAAAAATPAQEAQRATSADSPPKAAEAEPVKETPAAPPQRIPVPPMLRQRFLVLIEELVKSQVDESSTHSERPIVVSSELFAFVTQHVPVPNIQDEYRRKIFLLVNVAEDPETTRERHARHRAERKARLKAEGVASAEARRAKKRGKGDAVGAEGVGDSFDAAHSSSDVGDAEEKGEAAEEADMDPHGGANDIPAELRFLVSSLPLSLSPWASVMILREVLAESAGRNPRYTYVLNAAIDLQLPISTTRSRIATTLNMWRFLTTQSHKLSLKESLVMKQRCAWNLPLSYILSSYWSLLTWLTLASIVALNVVGIDWESQIVANSLFRMFAPWEEICATPSDEESAEEAWTTQAAADLAADYFEQAEIADRRREEHRRSSANVFLSSASYLILGYDDQRRPMTIIPIGSDRAEPADARVAEEYAAATAVLRELSLHAPFPFFVDIERALPIDLVESRIADRIRRVSFNNTWFLPRMIIRTFPLGRQYTEHKLILHTCTQANLTRRRVTFLLYLHDGVAITPQFIQRLNESYLSKHANLVLVAHESSLLKGGTSPALLAKISRVGAAPAAPGGVDGLESLASAAADVIESVLPDEAKGAAAASGRGTAATAVDGHVRVLPLCRQYYRRDGTMVADAVQGRLGEGAIAAAAGDSTVADRDDGAWWQRWLPAWAGGSVAVDAPAAVVPHPLPLFASAFSAQRASLHRSHQKQCEAESEAAAAAALQQQQQHTSGVGSAAGGVALVRRWGQWWKQTLSAAVGAPGQTMHVTPDGSWEEDEEEKEGRVAEPSRELPGASATTTPAPPLAPERSARSDYPSGFQDDAVEDRAGKDVVTVSFTALRRLMADVSAPVPVPRKKHSGTTGSSSSSSSSSSGGSHDEAAMATTVPADAVRGDNAETSPKRESTVGYSPVSTSEGGVLSRLWTTCTGGSAGESAATGKHEEAPLPVVSSAPVHAAPPVILRQPYAFTYNATPPTSPTNTTTTSSAPPTTTNNTTASTTPAATSSSRAATRENEAAATAVSGSSASRRLPDDTSRASASPLASSLSFASLPTASFARPNTYEWEGEWRKADELLAQLRRTTRSNA